MIYNKKLKILYVSNVCSEKEFASLFKDSKIFVSQQSQKFNRLMAEGFALNDCDVDVLSGRPVSSLQKQKKYRFKTEKENGINYNYLGFWNFKLIRNLMVSFNAKKFAKKWCKKNPYGIMVCDALNLSVSSACAKVFIKNKMKICSIITDIPEDLFNGRLPIKQKFFCKKYNQILSASNYFVLLSKHMINRLKVKRPSIVVEGLCDNNLIKKKKTVKKKKIIMYAGLLYKKYGVKILLDAFIKANLTNYELHFYGTGNLYEKSDDMLSEIKEVAKRNKNIKYMGTVSSAECFEKEKVAMLLVNPRPSKELFVKYSFPSKNIEYMSSGTPLLVTNLPSMPKEYKKFCYIVQNESVDGFVKQLRIIAKKSTNELKCFGKAAQQFIFKEKNNKKQINKIINLIERRK